MDEVFWLQPLEDEYEDDELLPDAIRLVVENGRLPFHAAAQVPHWLQPGGTIDRCNGSAGHCGIISRQQT